MRDMTEGFMRMRTGLMAALLATSVLPAAAQVAPQDYPQWRGQNRDGAASAFTAPKTWPEALTLKWKVDVGAGYATPILVGDRLFTMTRQNGSEVMMALDAGSGKTLWRTEYAAPYKMNPATKYHGEGPKSTPLFHNGKLFSLGITGIVSAFDAATGKLLWQKPAPPVEPLFGTAMSPVADRDLVIFHVGGHNKGAVTAFDVNNGTVKWEWAGDGPGYGSPMIATIAGTRQLITITQKMVVGLDVSNGRLLWERPLVARADTNSFTPIISGDIVIVSAHDTGVRAFRPVKQGDAWSTETAWEVSDVEMKLSNPVVVGDTLYGLSQKNSGQLFALDPRSGKVLWVGKQREAAHTSFVKSGDLLFLLHDDGRLVVAKSSRTAFEPLKTYTVADSATWAQPTLSRNRIFVKDVSSLALWTVD
jgi:outer membrane protein assembly factor BamB